MTQRLETARLVLRPFTSEDWAAVEAMLTEPTTTRYMHFAILTEAERREWFDCCVTDGQRAKPEAITWAVTRKAAGDVVGWFGIGLDDDPSFGYLLGRDFWNQGYMTEVLRAVLAYEFDVIDAPQVSATCNAENAASARVMEKAGMRRRKTEYGTDFRGNWVYRHHYAITKAEYEALTSEGSCG